jgi:hypothetical protein
MELTCGLNIIGARKNDDYHDRSWDSVQEGAKRGTESVEFRIKTHAQLK